MPFLRALGAARSPLPVVEEYPSLRSPELDELEEQLARIRAFRDAHWDGAAIDRAGRMPLELVPRLAELGLFGWIFPRRHGGLDHGSRAYVRMFDALAWECQAICMLLGGHLSLAGRGLLLFGTEDQQDRWFPPMGSGACIGAFALSEAEAGSDFRSMKTVARPAGGGWKIQGEKLWVTSGPEAGMILTFAQIEDGNLDGMGAFLVRGDADGLTVGPLEEKMGLRGSTTTAVAYDEVFVPDEDVLGEPGRGFKMAVEILNRGRTGWSGACLGVTRRALHEAGAYARERVQYGQPIVRYGMIREHLAGIAADLATLEAFSDFVAGLTDTERGDTVLESAALKIFSTEASNRALDRALQIAGGPGYSQRLPYERMVRDSRISRIFEGTNEVMRMLVARQMATYAKARGDAGDWQAPGGLGGEWLPHWERLREDAAALQAANLAVQKSLGRQFRDAQPHHRRLANQAISLAARTAILLRKSAEPRWGEDPVLDYALQLRALEFAQAGREEASPLDDSMEAAAAVVEARS